MEKFTNWRDKATGISPFIPVSNLKLSKFEILLKIPVFLLKLPIFIILSILLVVTSPICKIYKLVLRLYLSLITNLISIPKLPKGEKLSANDLIIVNFSSFIDVLILSFLEPNSQFIINDSQNRIRLLSRWQLICRSISNPNLEDGEILTDINQLPRGKLTWYFVEGTTSNNKSILKFTIPFTELDTDKDIKTLTMMKSNWIITCLPTSFIKIIWIQLSSLQSLKLNLKMSKKIEKLDLQFVKQSLQQNKLKSVNLDINDKIEFLKAFNKS